MNKEDHSLFMFLYWSLAGMVVFGYIVAMIIVFNI